MDIEIMIIFLVGIVFVLPIVAIVWVSRLSSRVKRLEQLIDSRSAMAFGEAKSGERVSEFPLEWKEREEQPVGSQLPEVPAPQISQSHRYEGDPDWLKNLIAWIKEDWLLKLGVLLVLIGFGWLTSYAFLHDWIGPIGRITLGILLGVVLLAFGFQRIKTHVSQGGVFMVFGSTVILITVFTARFAYDFFTPFSALVLMFLSTALVAFASVRFRLRSLAITSLILSAVAPLLTHTPDPSVFGLFGYLFAVVAGTLWIAWLRKWETLPLLSLVIVFFYSAAYLIDESSATGQDSIGLFFAFLFVALFFASGLVGIVKGKSEKILLALSTAAGNALFLLVWVMEAAPEEWQSLIVTFWALVFALGAYSIYRITLQKVPFSVYGGIATVLLGVATALELSGPVLVIAFTLEAAVLTFLSTALSKDIGMAEKVSWIFLVPIWVSLPSFLASEWSTKIFHDHFFALVTLAVVLSALGGIFLKKQSESGEAVRTGATLLITGSLYGLALVWLVSHAFFGGAEDIATTFSLTFYAFVGVALYFIGQFEEKKWVKMYGGILLGLVVARLLLVDVWSMELTGKIITFFLIGSLLVATAFIKRGKKDTDISDFPHYTKEL